jgi:hypothetical protein
MVKKIILFLLLGVLVVIVGVGLALNSAAVGEKVFPVLLNRYFQGPAVENLRIGRQVLELPDTFILEDVEFTFRNDKAYTVHFKRFHVDAGEAYLSPVRNVKLNMEGLSVSSKELEIRDVAAALKMPFSTKVFRGPVSASVFGFAPYRVTDLKAQAVISDDEIEFHEITAEGYAGQLKGQVVLDLKPQMPFLAQVELIGVELNEMEGVNPEFFSKLSGPVEGLMIFVGEAGHLRSLDVDLKTTSGGKVRASVLKQLIEYIPDEFQQQQFEAIDSAGGDVLLETAQLEVKSISEEQVKAHVVFASRQLNLQVDLTLEFNIEGGLRNMLGLLEKLSR